MKKVTLSPITFRQILDCFSGVRYHKNHYIGINWNLFTEGTERAILLDTFLDFVADEAKPKWCPKWFMNLLHLFGNDNSIYRVRNRRLHNLHRKLSKGIMILDIKEKWGTLRIYGYFNKEIEVARKELCNKIDPTLDPY